MAQLNEDSWREGMANSEAQARRWGCGCLLLVVGALLIGLLWPAVGSGPVSKRAQSANVLKQIGLALHTYHDMAGAFPARAIFSPEGKPLLSWRVTLLPWLEGAELYTHFHLDESWDSPHNIQLIDKMPQVLRSPKSLSKDKTHYLAVTGPGTVFEGKAGVSINAIEDGINNTIVVVEADQEVIWTKPEELEFDPATPRNNLNGLYPTGAMALIADGSARLLRKELDDETLRALMTKAGGENVRPPD